MLQDFALWLLRGIGDLLMIPVRFVAVFLARFLYPMSIVGFFGSIGLAGIQASKGAWQDMFVALLTVLFSAGLFLASKVVLRKWYTPSSRPRVQYVYRESIY